MSIVMTALRVVAMDSAKVLNYVVGVMRALSFTYATSIVCGGGRALSNTIVNLTSK